jgi:hypothetical protein
MHTSHSIRRGWQAVDRSGDKIGTVEEIGAAYFVVSKGVIFPRDIYVPVGRVLGTDSAEGVVRLDIDKDRVSAMGWDHAPLDALSTPAADRVMSWGDSPGARPGTTAGELSGTHDISSALARWRAAERRCDAAAPGSPERAEAEQQCDEAHAAYERLAARPTVQLAPDDNIGPPGLGRKP